MFQDSISRQIYSRFPPQVKPNPQLKFTAPKPTNSGEMYAFSLKESGLSKDVIDRLQFTDRIILPGIVLEKLIFDNVPGPYVFNLINPQIGISMVVGVEQFIHENTVYLPNWIMEQLSLTNSQKVSVKPVIIPKGKFALFKSDSSSFDLMENKEAFLENALKNFTVLNTGDIIPLRNGDTKFRLEVLDLKPSSSVLILDTDLEFDFQESEETKYLKIEEENKRKQEQEQRIVEAEKKLQELNRKKFNFATDKAPAAVNVGAGLSFKPAPVKPTGPFSGAGQTLSGKPAPEKIVPAGNRLGGRSHRSRLVPQNPNEFDESMLEFD